MLFSYNWLNDHLKYKIPPQQLAELLTTHAYKVESVSQKGDDWVLDIEVMPNRAADSYSHQGISREINSIIDFQITNNKLRIKKKAPKSKLGDLPESKAAADELVSVEIEDKEGCRLYIAKTVEGVKVGDSPQWLKKRLQAVGVEPVNNIVDITNFVMLDSGQPLHAFDFNKIKSVNSNNQNSKQRPGQKKIIVRRAKKGEKLEALDGHSYQLSPEVLVIADSQASLAIAGIKGGQRASITRKTKNIVIEAANFEPTRIYTSARRLGIQTDASRRFSAGVPLSLAEPAVRQAAFLMAKIAGGQAGPTVVSGSGRQFSHRDVALNLERIKNLLGLEIKPKTAEAALKALGFSPGNKTKTGRIFHIPDWRPDITREEDLIEEVGRLIGYQSIASEAPYILLQAPPPNDLWQFRQTLANFLATEGFEEVYSYFLTGRQHFELLGISPEQPMQVANPLSRRRQFLRASVLPGLWEAVWQSAKFYKEFRLFEIGKVVNVKGEENWQVGGLVYQGAGRKQLTRQKYDEFLAAKGALESVLSGLGFNEVHFQSISQEPAGSIFWEAGTLAEVHIQEQKMGIIGRLSQGLGLKGGAVAFELAVEPLVELLEGELEYSPIPKHPAVLRDVSILVDMTVKASHILNIIQRVGGNLVEDVDLFDYYEGENLPESKKSLAFHIIYRHPDRTLSDAEVDQVHKKIEKALKKELKAQIR